MEIRDLVLVDGVRTPMAEYNGSFADVSAIDLGAHAARALFEKTGIDPAGDRPYRRGQRAPDLARRHLRRPPRGAQGRGAARRCRRSPSTASAAPASQSVISGAQAILTGDATTCLVGGMENMSQAPHVIWGARRGFKLGQGQLQDLLMVALMDSYCGCYMAQTSNNLARDYGISREEQDAVRHPLPAAGGRGVGDAAGWPRRSCRSRWGRGSGRSSIDKDDHLRPETTMEDLAGLPTAFDKDGFVTAGNASGIVDGAAMMILSTAQKAREKGWKPLGRILSWSVVGVEPSRMGIGPAPAIRAALGKLGMELGDVDLFEINEAFAGPDPGGGQGPRPRRRQAQRQRRRHRPRPSAGRDAAPAC